VVSLSVYTLHFSVDATSSFDALMLYIQLAGALFCALRATIER